MESSKISLRSGAKNFSPGELSRMFPDENRE